ncbi:MAG: ATP-binding cassette domain-containing protein, partial [Thermoproteus sp.]
MALSVKELSSAYGKVQVLFDISLEINKGGITALIGPNGAGKTTTLFSIMGVVRPLGGHIYFNGVDVTYTPTHKKVEMGIVLVPEGRRLFPDMTVEENLL